MRSDMRQYLAIAALAVCIGCTGQLQLGVGGQGSAGTTTHPETGEEVVEVGPGNDEPTDPADVVEPVDVDECASIDPKPVADVPARLLTAPELQNALEQMFGDLEIPTVEMPLDTRVGGFALNARDNVSADHVRDIRLLAEEMATRVAEDVDAVAPCSAEDPQAVQDCGHDALYDLAATAFRRPLTDEEKTRFAAVYDAGFDEGGHAEAMRWGVEALLQAPTFLYVAEDVSAAQLDDFEIAQRMAATLWRSIPDDELLAAAGNGELSDPATREGHARRMLDDARGQQMMRSLVVQWLGLDQLDTQAFAQDESFAPLVEAMGEETLALVDHVVAEKQASWTELLTSRYAFVDETLAAHYGVSLEDAEQVSDGLWRVEMPDRAGILGQAGFLALHHGPVHRGLAIRKAILCDVVPGPAGVDTEAIPTEEGESERSKSMKRLDEGACGGCHSMMDPLGLTYEVFGPLGAPRTEDIHGNAVASDGEISRTEDADAVVADSVELADRLAESEDVRQCVAENLFVWAFARTAEPTDGCTVARIEGALQDNDDNLKEALVKIVSHDMFTRRVAAGGE